MATRIAWLLNLDADHELREPARYRPSPQLSARVRELVPRMSMLLRPGDIVLDSTPDQPEDVPEGCSVLAFCPTPSALYRLEQRRLSARIRTPVEVLRRVNDRAFCAELGQTMPHARFVRDLASLEAALRAPSPSASFVIKRPFGFAGRERRRAEGGQLDASTLGFVARSFARGEGLQVEPWVERRGDFSRHGWVSVEGAVWLGPVVRQRCTAMGRWEEASTAEPGALSEEEQALLETEVTRTGEALREAGYRGPFGVDAFRYIGSGGALSFQPRCEVNARFTMGFPRELLDLALAPE